MNRLEGALTIDKQSTHFVERYVNPGYYIVLSIS